MKPSDKNNEYAKSNFLIGAKYRSSLLENKIMAVSMSKLKRNMATDENGCITCTLEASELRELIHANKGSFYSKLEPIAKSMTGRNIGMSDPETKRFRYLAVIITADYADGKFTIKFNPDLKNYIVNISENFTKLDLPTMMAFESVYSFRLYELLKSRSYNPKNAVKNNNQFVIEYSLSELKLSLGIVNAELDNVKRILSDSSMPDYDKAVAKSPEKSFADWYSFRTRVLDVARKEINEKTDITLEYVPKRSGRGGKTTSVIFVVILNGKINIAPAEEIPEFVPITQEEKDDLLDRIADEMQDLKLKIKDLRAIAEAANYEYYRIYSAYMNMQMSDTEIQNPVAFMISAIKNEYILPRSKIAKFKEQMCNQVYEQYEQEEIKWEENGT